MVAKMNFAATAAILACLSPISYIFGQQPEGAGNSMVPQVCLGCICETASGCNSTIGCDESVCGPFRITWQYWADAGKPTLNDQPSTANNAYSECVNEPYCAARTVQAYMAKFAQDCNGDGYVNCDDFLRIHRLGGYGCSGPLNAKYEATYKLCMKTFDRNY